MIIDMTSSFSSRRLQNAIAHLDEALSSETQAMSSFRSTMAELGREIAVLKRDLGGLRQVEKRLTTVVSHLGSQADGLNKVF